jgi:hypothetical protein
MNVTDCHKKISYFIKCSKRVCAFIGCCLAVYGFINTQGRPKLTEELTKISFCLKYLE